MNNKKDETAKPRLRFPEFQDADGWEKKLLSQYLVDCSGRTSPDTNLPIYSSTREGLKRQDLYFGGATLQNTNDYGVVPPDCFVYRHMSDDGLFKFNINETGGDIAVSKEYPVFNTRDLNPRFLLSLLNDSAEFKRFALSQKTGGTRTRLYFSKLGQWQSWLPSPNEQKKIADCFDALDELIIEKGNAAKTLIAYKNALMLQILPREGEVQPRLRFPEFRRSEKWKIRALGQLVKYENGKAYEKDIHDGGKYVVANSRFISTDGEVRKFTNAEHLIARAGEVLMVLSDLPKGKALAKCYFVEAEERYAVNQRVCRLKPTEIDGKFLYYALNRHPRLLSYDDGLNQTHLSIGNVTECPLCIPAEQAEQHRIAECLTDLDSRITAAGQEIEMLMAHKKGLMQQLFPSTHEVGT